MELVFTLGLVVLGLGLWAQTKRIETLTRKIEELERRLSGAPAPAAELPPLLLDQPVPGDDEPLVLDKPLPIGAIPAPAPLMPQLAAGGVVLLALFAPALSAWPPAIATFYLTACGAAAISFAALKRWAWPALSAVLGMYLWFAFSVANGDTTRALAMIGIASIGAALLSLREGAPEQDEAWSHMRAFAPGAAVSAGAVLLVWTWFIAAAGAPELAAGPALLSALHVVAAAWLVRDRIAAPQTLPIAIAGLVVGAIVYRLVRADAAPLGENFFPILLVSALIVVISALGARTQRDNDKLITGAGAVGAALLVLVAAFSRMEWHTPLVWSALFAGAAALFTAGLRIADDVRDPGADARVAIWIGAAAALALTGVESLFPIEARTTGQALAALTFAAALSWRRWRVFGWAALAAAALAVTHSLSVLFGGTAASGPGSFAALGGAAVLLFAASIAAARAATPKFAPGVLSTAAIAILLIAAFVGLSSVGLSTFTEAAVRALVLAAAGTALVYVSGHGSAWRGPALILCGLLYALIAPGAEHNPWWGAVPSIIEGPPVFNAMSLAFIAPAVLGFFAARRTYPQDVWLGRAYAVLAALLTVIWLVLEARRLFRGALMSDAPIGLVEGASYSLLALAIACGVAAAARTVKKDAPWAQDLNRIVRPIAWTCLIFAALVLLVLRHPWWGSHDATATDGNTAALAVLAHIAACALSLVIGRLLSTKRGPDLTRFAAAALAAVLGWSAGHAVIRFRDHGAGMDGASAMNGVEGLAHSIWPLLFVSATAWITARAPGRHTVRAYLFDLQAIWAAAIWPALVFAMLGLWVIFNPWWGLMPAAVVSPIAAALMIAACLIASALSAASPSIAHVRWKQRLTQVSTFAWMGHLLVADTLAVRWLNHGEQLRGASITAVEMWTYAITWALLATAIWFTRPQQERRAIGAAAFFMAAPSARRGRRYGRRQRS